MSTTEAEIEQRAKAGHFVTGMTDHMTLLDATRPPSTIWLIEQTPPKTGSGIACAQTWPERGMRLARSFVKTSGCPKPLCKGRGRRGRRSDLCPRCKKRYTAPSRRIPRQLPRLASGLCSVLLQCGLQGGSGAQVTDIKALAKEALKLSEQATEGPWEQYADDDDVIGYTIAKMYPNGWPLMFTATVPHTHRGTEEVLDNYEFIAFARNALPTLAQALLVALDERDQAIAHDRQPYPTAEAYERVCAARTKWQEKAETLQAQIEAFEERTGFKVLDSEKREN